MFSIEVDRVAIAIAVICAASMLVLRLTSPPMAVLALALTLLTFLTVIRPVGAISAVAATLPWFYHPIALGSQRFAASELLLAVVVAGFAVRSICAIARNPAGTRRLVATTAQGAISPLTLTLTILTVAGAVLSIYPYDPVHRAESLREWRWTLVEPLAFLILLGTCVRLPQERTLIASGLIAGGAVAALQGFTDLAFGGGVDVAGVIRIAGPYPHPNALALAGARIAAFGLAWWAYSRWRALWILAPSVLITLAVAASLSRGALLALAVAGLFVIPRLNRSLRAGVVAGSVFLVMALIIVARDRMLDLFSGGSASLRLDIWSSALRMIEARPIRGYGPDQFLYAYLPRYVEPTAWGERFTAHAHSLLLDFWIRLGIIGLAFIVMVVVVCARLVLRVVRGRSDGDLKAAAVVALAASLTHGLIDNAYFAHDLAMSGWLLAWFALETRATDSAEGTDNGAGPGHRRRWLHWFPSLR